MSCRLERKKRLGQVPGGKIGCHICRDLFMKKHSGWYFSATRAPPAQGTIRAQWTWRGFQAVQSWRSRRGPKSREGGHSLLPSFETPDYLNFCRIMIAYLKVMHLFLSLPTPMRFSNPEVIMFWQKFIGTSVFPLRSAGHCATLTAAQRRAAPKKPSTMAVEGRARAGQVSSETTKAVPWGHQPTPSHVPSCSGLSAGSGLGG